MDTLFVAWQQPDSLEWIPVGVLERKTDDYCFSYTQGLFRAKDFQPFSGMQELSATYKSKVLFPLFSNRLISKSRPEFADYLRWLGLTCMDDDPLSMLALTGGVRGTDSIELFQPPSMDGQGNYNVDFFSRSLSHLPAVTVGYISQMKKGDGLFLMRDCQNSFDHLALAIRTDTPSYFVGYVPKYYAQDLGELLNSQLSQLKISVKSVNVDAPLNMRLLCSVSAVAPSGFSPLSNARDFQKIDGSLPATWGSFTDTFDSMLGE